MTGRIDDDVLALLGPKPDLGSVDGDVLIAFGLQSVHQVGPLEGNTAALGDLLKLLQLAIGQRARVIKEASHKSGLAVVHMADDDDLELLNRSRSGVAVR